MTNGFRMTPDRSLDRRYLRYCATRRLFERGKIDKARAIELLTEHHGKISRACVEMWMSCPPKHVWS